MTIITRADCLTSPTCFAQAHILKGKQTQNLTQMTSKNCFCICGAQTQDLRVVAVGVDRLHYYML